MQKESKNKTRQASDRVQPKQGNDRLNVLKVSNSGTSFVGMVQNIPGIVTGIVTGNLGRIFIASG